MRKYKRSLKKGRGGGREGRREGLKIEEGEEGSKERKGE